MQNNSFPLNRRTIALCFILLTFGVVVSFFEFVGLLQFNKAEKMILFFISQVLFLNMIHVAFSFDIMISHQKNTEKKYHFFKKNRKLIFIVLISLVMSFVFIFINFRLPFVAHPTRRLIFVLFEILLIGFFTIRHRLYQSYGVFNMFDRSQNYKSRRHYENKVIFSIFVWLTITNYSISIAHHILEKNLNSIKMMIILSFFQLFIALFFIYKKINDKHSNENKIFYLILLTWVLAPYSMAATMLTTCVHGIEYFYIYRSYNLVKQRRWVAKTTLIICVSVVFVGILRALVVQGKSGVWQNPAVVTIASVSIFFSILHFYLDGEMYSSKKEKNIVNIILG